MGQLINKSKEVIRDKNLYIFSIITLLFFGIFCIPQYASDTYHVFTTNIKESALYFCSCGRYITGMGTILALKILKLGNIGTYYFSYIFAIMCMIISLYRLNNLIKKEINNNLLSMLISTIILINPFSIELWIYIEKGIMILSILLCILAVEQIIRVFEGNKKRIILSLIYMILATSCYQGTIGLFVVLSLFYILKYSNNLKRFLTNNIISALVYGVSALLNLITVRVLFINDRVSGNIVLAESISKIISGTKNMIINTYEILPKYLFLITILLIILYLVYKIFRTRKNYKIKILGMFKIGYFVLGAIVVTILPQIMQDTESIWFVARSSYSMGSIVGILLLFLLKEFNIEKIENYLITLLIVIFILIQFVCFIKISIDNYICNYLDKIVTLKISSLIEEYENKTQNFIDTIAIYQDEQKMYVYPGLKASGDMNTRAYSADWCIDNILKFYIGRDFNIIEPNIELKEKFLQKNWDEFNEEQIIFENNIMHICVF